MTDLHAAVLRALLDGRAAEAERLLSAQLAQKPDDPRALALAGRAAGMRGDHAAMLTLLERAVDAAPCDGENLATLARCRMRAQDIAGAEQALGRALASGALSDIALDALAGTLAQAGRHREAIDLLRREPAASARNAAIAFNLGTYLKFAGDFGEARQAYRRAIALAPDFHKAHAALASLGGAAADEGSLAAIEALIARSDDPHALLHLHHAAARLCHAAGRYEESWAHLGAGKARVISHLGADPAAVLPALDRLIAVVEERFAPVPSQPPRGPILILGMPRTGTTVLDRILSNHDEVTSIGETLFFAQALKAAAGSRSGDLVDAPLLAALEDTALLRGAGAAFAAHGERRIAGRGRFLDKFHLNVLLAPHLLQALPGARMLCLVRDPLDTIVSNYRQLFDTASGIYRYALDIEATAAFHVRFRHLAALLEARAPERFRTISYEALATAPEALAPELLAFCGLPWQPDCTRIEANAASVATASAVQVRDGISTRYVGGWRHYAPWLGGARDIIAAAGLTTE